MNIILKEQQVAWQWVCWLHWNTAQFHIAKVYPQVLSNGGLHCLHSLSELVMLFEHDTRYKRQFTVRHDTVLRWRLQARAQHVSGGCYTNPVQAAIIFYAVSHRMHEEINYVPQDTFREIYGWVHYIVSDEGNQA